MFLKDTWYVAAWPNEIEPGKPFARTICSEPIVFFRTAGGGVAALEDRCCHRHYPLSKGKVCDGVIRCGYHGFEYAGDGRCVKVPSQSIIPDGTRVRSYPCVQKHNLVWIWMGDPARADPAAIVDFSWLDSPQWRWKGTMYPVKANYELVVENLLDLTHIAFLHESTIGNYALVNAEMRTTRTDDEVTVSRWMVDSDPPPTYQKAGNFAGKVDRWQIIRYSKPALVRLSVGAMDHGAGAKDFMGDGFQPHPPRTNGIGMFNFNMITPQTERTTHYFWAQGHDFRLEDPKVTELVFSQVEIAFHEDWAVFELIQDRMDSHPGRDPKAAYVAPADLPRVDVNGDSGGIQAIRILHRAIAAEEQRLQGVGTRAA